MRKAFAFILFLLSGVVFLSFVACNDGDGNVIVVTDEEKDDDPSEEVETGEGIDPGKEASGCYPAFQDDELNVVTWNMQGLDANSNTFNAGGTDLNKLKSAIISLDADIIAVQEIYSIATFNSIANDLEDFSAYAMDISGDLNLGYLVKKDAFLEIGNVFSAVSTSPRLTLGMKVKHASGLEVTLLNIHLKCCGGSSNESSRANASAAIKSYIDSSLSDEAVILLGDYNDALGDPPFQNFTNDPTSYRFADESVTVPSYPDWPSDLDHILITNELFDKLGAVQTLTLDNCISSYLDDVSDHRPVIASFKWKGT